MPMTGSIPATNTPRPFAVNNQWSASFGGPIIKNKTFFFVDTEGLRYVLPSVQNIFLPTQGFETAVLNNLTATGRGAEIPFYNQMFSLYNSAPGYANYSSRERCIRPHARMPRSYDVTPALERAEHLVRCSTMPRVQI